MACLGFQGVLFIKTEKPYFTRSESSIFFSCFVKIYIFVIFILWYMDNLKAYLDRPEPVLFTTEKNLILMIS